MNEFAGGANPSAGPGLKRGATQRMNDDEDQFLETYESKMCPMIKCSEGLGFLLVILAVFLSWASPFLAIFLDERN